MPVSFDLQEGVEQAPIDREPIILRHLQMDPQQERTPHRIRDIRSIFWRIRAQHVEVRRESALEVRAFLDLEVVLPFLLPFFDLGRSTAWRMSVGRFAEVPITVTRSPCEN